jgi:hypothetical protein
VQISPTVTRKVQCAGTPLYGVGGTLEYYDRWKWLFLPMVKTQSFPVMSHTQKQF